MRCLEKEQREMYILGWVVLGLGGLLLVFLKITGIMLTNIVPPCLFRHLTGYCCPGCGGTRAAELLLQGAVIKSFWMHPIVLYGAGIYSWFMISTTIECLLDGRKKVGLRYQGGLVTIGIVLLILHLVIKNGAILLQ